MKFLTIALIVAALAVLVWVVGCKTQQAGTPPAENSASAPAEMPAGHDVTGTDQKAPAQPMGGVTIGADEASCPVLGTVMKKSMMTPIQHNGKTYYMCCRDCISKFKADPEQYSNHPAAPTRDVKM